MLFYKKKIKRIKKKQKIFSLNKQNDLISLLEFKLTRDQHKTLNEINEDLSEFDDEGIDELNEDDDEFLEDDVSDVINTVSKEEDN